MTSIVNPYVAGLLAVAAVDAATAGYAVTRWERPGARPVALLLAGAAVWSVAYAVQLSTTGAGVASGTLAVQFMAANMMAVGVLGFGLEYTGRRVLVTLRRLRAARGVSLTVLLVSFTNPIHGAVWTLRGVELRAGLAIRSIAWEPAAIAFGVWLVVVAAVGVGLIGVFSWRTGGLYRRQLAPFGAALGIVTLADVAWALGLSPVQGLVLFPYATGLAALSFGVGALWFDLFERSPVSPSRAHDVAVAGLSTPVAVVDDDGHLLHHNPAAAAMFPDDGEGDPLEAHLPALANRLAAADEAFEADLTATVDGRRRHFAVGATPMDAGWVVTMLDVTDRVLREQRLDVLNRLLRHNVRNETSVVLGHGQRVAEADDEGLAAAGETIVAAAETLAAVSDEAHRVGTLLDTEAAPATVDAAAAVRAVAADQREAYPAATIEVAAPGAAMTRCHVGVREAVAELIENAVVHSDRASPAVEVTVEDGDDWVAVAVADDGPGIPDAELAAIREGRETQLVHASGLGLWMVSWTTTASGGRMTVEEREPRGSVVRLELPAE